ncbi:MAG TPA: phage head closure protein [Terriglobales bacterium]|nr:phage head closure protein [Terriglobales bacterium]
MFNKLTRRIDILTPNSEQDSAGGLLPPVELLTGVWAGVEDLTGKEAWTAQQFASDVNVKFTVRNNPLIAANQIIRFESRLYTISYVRDPASALTSVAYNGSVAGHPRLLRGMYLELFCALFNGGN